MRRIVASGSVLGTLFLIYLLNPLLAWAALGGTAVFLSIRRTKQDAPQSIDR
jgi:hypothetical protein